MATEVSFILHGAPAVLIISAPSDLFLKEI